MTTSETAPLVSIGMPVYNGERFIRKALDSLLEQNFKDFELIISDNASEDATQQICFEYASKDSRIRYYRNEINLGAIENSRNVLEISSGKYFMFAADHDLYDPNFISRCVEILEQDSSVVLCYPKTAWIDTDGKFLEIIPGHFDTRGLKQISRFNVTLWRLGYCYQFYGLMRLDAFRQTNTYEGVVGPDVIRLSELSLLGAFAYVPELLFHMRKMPDYGDWNKYVGKLKIRLAIWSALYMYLDMIYRHLLLVRYVRSYINKVILLTSVLICMVVRYYWVLAGLISSSVRK
jgi:glycosyltransferase involved in cell wall biosynthesis